MSTAELEKIYDNCVTAIAVSPASASPQSCGVEFSHNQEGQIVINYSSEAGDSSPDDECDTEPNNVAICAIDEGSLSASVESIDTGTIAEDRLAVNAGRELNFIGAVCAHQMTGDGVGFAGFRERFRGRKSTSAAWLGFTGRFASPFLQGEVGESDRRLGARQCRSQQSIS